MIFLTKTDKSMVVVNPDMIEFIEKTPDTVITMNTGEKILVVEPPEKIIEMTLAYHRKLLHGQH